MTDGDDILKDAIAGTELEIFSEAVGKDLPSTEGGPGDRSVEEMGEGLEGQLEPEETASEATAKDGDGDGEGAADKTEGDGKDGDRDPKTGQFKSKTEGDETGKEAKADDKTKTPAKDDDADLLEADGKPKQRVPVSDLVKERKSRRAAEARIRELETAPPKVSSDEIERIVNARIAELVGSKVEPKQEPSAAATEEPDIFENPDAWKASTTAAIERQVTQKYVAADLARTAKAHGEKFDTAYKAFTSLDKGDPAVRAQAQRIWNSATPGDDLMAWYGRQEAQRLVGDDPAAYAAKVAKEEREKLVNDPEFRKELLASLRADAEAGEGGTPRHIARMPKSLNGAAGGQSQGNGAGLRFDGSDKGVFEDAFRDQ